MVVSNGEIILVRSQTLTLVMERQNQCADAVIYLRALWLWQTKQYDKIHFNFTNGFRADYTRWAKGERIHIDKKTWRCWYSKDTAADYSYKTFRKYLNLVFTYAGTASLEKELTTITGKELQVGDVIINGGHPGHTVIVVDKAVNKKGEAVYLLAQGYTPAQEIEIFNQWFSINPQIKYLDTPDWYFRGNYAKRFQLTVNCPQNRKEKSTVNELTVLLLLCFLT